MPMTDGGRALWDAEAETFDQAADHGLADPAVRAAWQTLLLDLLPDPPASVADLGCGTGTLAVLLAGCGFDVDGLDFSPRMVALARAKAEGLRGVGIVEGDAFDPPLPPASYDVVLVRHVLWAMPDPSVAIERWSALVRPGGRLVLIEGRWGNGVGLDPEETVRIVAAAGWRTALIPLPDLAYWGREIDDVRYAVLATGRDS